MEPRQQPAELRELLSLIEEIKVVSVDGLGTDELSNAALALIGARIGRVETVVRALDETTMFDTAKILEVIRSTIRP